MIALLMIAFSPTALFAWGDLGHQTIVRLGNEIADKKTFSNCRITQDEIITHTTDPDHIWKKQSFKFRNEGLAHFFHVDRQPVSWKERKSSEKNSQNKDGFLVYRINAWREEAKELRKKQKWEELKIKLYGLSHYVGDLSQPLHLTSDHDGVLHGLAGLHSQFETKMLNRFKNELPSLVKSKLAQEKIPSYWETAKSANIVFNLAEANFQKSDDLFNRSKKAIEFVGGKKSKNKITRITKRFLKKRLWNETKDLASNQLAQSARLWAFFLNDICL